MNQTEKKFLYQLLETPSPTGHEIDGQRVWAKYLKAHADEIAHDSYGSAWATLQGKSERTLMLAAHADEIGWMIKHIQDDGFLRLERVGGIDHAVARGRRLRILGDKGELPGIIGNTAIHLRHDELGSEKAPKVHELWVDVGAASADDVKKLGLRVGHYAVYADGPMSLGKDLLVSRAIDNRIGSYIIAQVMRRIAARKTKPSFTLVCLNAVQEEIGGNGAMMAAYALNPDACICLDVTHATDTPGINQAKTGAVSLGGGPTVSHGSSNHPVIVKKLMDVAQKSKITLQHESSNRGTGTDTDKIFHQRAGIPSALVSLPLRCMHSCVETAHLKDVENLISLLVDFTLALSEKEEFHQKI